MVAARVADGAKEYVPRGSNRNRSDCYEGEKLDKLETSAAELNPTEQRCYCAK